MEKNRCPECKNILYSVDELFYDKDGIRPAKYCAACYKLFESHSFGLVEKKHKTWVSKRIAELESERDRLKAEVKDLRYSLEHIDCDERYTKLRARLERLVAAAKAVTLETAHAQYCNAIKGPYPENWTEDKDCDCSFKELKAAIAEAKEVVL